MKEEGMDQERKKNPLLCHGTVWSDGEEDPEIERGGVSHRRRAPCLQALHSSKKRKPCPGGEPQSLDLGVGLRPGKENAGKGQSRRKTAKMGPVAKEDPRGKRNLPGGKRNGISQLLEKIRLPQYRSCCTRAKKKRSRQKGGGGSTSSMRAGATPSLILYLARKLRFMFLVLLVGRKNGRSPCHRKEEKRKLFPFTSSRISIFWEKKGYLLAPYLRGERGKGRELQITKKEP